MLEIDDVSQNRKILVAQQYCSRSKANTSLYITPSGDDFVNVGICCGYAIPNGEHVRCKQTGAECPVFETLVKKVLED